MDIPRTPEQVIEAANEAGKREFVMRGALGGLYDAILDVEDDGAKLEAAMEKARRALGRDERKTEVKP